PTDAAARDFAVRASQRGQPRDHGPGLDHALRRGQLAAGPSRRPVLRRAGQSPHRAVRVRPARARLALVPRPENRRAAGLASEWKLWAPIATPTFHSFDRSPSPPGPPSFVAVLPARLGPSDHRRLSAP